MDSRKKTGRGNDDEQEQIEQLLQAAQDDLMLKLTLDSHMSRVSPNYLHSDLDRRFQALRSRPSSTAAAVPRNPRSSHPHIQSDSSSRPPPPIENLVVDGESQSILDDDLAARFAALKASLPSSTTPPSSSIPNDVDSADEEDEVEKLIQWAKDAARLDPSPPSEEDDEEEEFISSDEDVNDRIKERRKKKAG
ncbi:transcription initiation factor TFIID subunit 11 isoform X3 [Cucumis melo var. makuwa]|uniref:Transcription initiation factor TFIID subunit 11 isoform X3 n=1 Tax=Cucumis melo var. makuwa TaxID=1194695 RepID=A0A5A7VFP6_CUCMM|nr:transcription initiation factor TFIID subunit 11 isoform X3 [Cucumis melo var. makuwa]